MNMFCFQCQEAAKNYGCTIKGVCGKTGDVANFQDLLMHVVKGIAVLAEETKGTDLNLEKENAFMLDAIFSTITNANFDRQAIEQRIIQGLQIRDNLKNKVEKITTLPATLPDCVTWNGSVNEFEQKSNTLHIIDSPDSEDVRSLKELLIYGIKGIAAYADHAFNLGYKDESIYGFMTKGLAATVRNDISVEELLPLVNECGGNGVKVMDLLDKANTTSYGHPEISEVNLGVRKNPGILISGHDLKDMEELLKQTEGTGIDVYTHSEMLPANYYPAFKKYDHFVGNYGNSWWKQKEEFEAFNGPVLLTTNCLVPPKASYIDRVYTTGSAGFEKVKHIPGRTNGQPKDFSSIIEHAKQCEAPEELETGNLVGGFAHNQVTQLADKVVDAVKTGAIRKFFVMAGCDGRMKNRDYYTQFADTLPKDTVILTAGCAKYRYNKLPLGDINGIPRVLDAGQCNDSYSLAVIALKLKEIFELNDINELPIEYNIAWYEQKAVIVLLALLYLGVKNIHLGPTLPAFLSPNVVNVLVENYGIKGISTVEQDVESMIA
jgi:hydroxylamine reductase